MAHFFKPKSNQHRRSRAGSRANIAVPEKPLKIINQLMITRFSDDGRGIASHHGKTIFVTNALPGEVVDVSVTREKSTFSESIAQTVSKHSPSRTEPLCGHYEECGGCHLQHMSPQEQHNFKLTNVLKQLKHNGDITPTHILPTITGDSYSYRQRVRLSVAHVSEKTFLGFRKANSKSLVDLDECVVMAKPLSQLLRPLREWLNKYKPAVTHVELINSTNGIGLIVRHVKPISIVVRKKLASLLKDFQVSCWFQANKVDELTTVDDVVCDPKLCYHIEFVSDEIKRKLIYFHHPQDFIQANALVNQKIIHQAIELLKPNKDEVFLDLFCGIGNFSLPLSVVSKYVVGVEGSGKMVAQASSNALSNQCDNIAFVQANLFDEIELQSIRKDNRLAGGIDGIILDPPRAGAEEVCENITKLSPKKILYVSCDPNTFARDAQILANKNYSLESFSVADMFSQTYHSEVMGLFIRKGKSTANFSTKAIL